MIPKVKHGQTPDFLAVIPCAYEIIEIAELVKEETNGNAIIEPDKNTMKSLMDYKTRCN